MKTTPSLRALRVATPTPLKGATPAARQSRFRGVLRRGIAALAVILCCGPVFAQSEAQKQLASNRFTIISPFPPGGPVDTLARMLSEGLGKRYGQAAVVENDAGAAGNIGMDKVKRAKADGHT